MGVFTEVKDSVLCSGVRARHHSYLGDAVIGDNVNIGAGSLTANFDGKEILKTRIGRDSFIGPGSVLVAPIDIGDGSYVKPGTLLSQNGNSELGK